MHHARKRSGPAGPTPRLRWIFATISSLCLLATTIMALQAPAAHAAGTAYYVDCSASSNGNGTQGSPWNTLSSVNSHTFGPGDQILLRAGTSCNGYLQASGSGASGSPITIDRYGPGTPPTINNNGTLFANQPQQAGLLAFPQSAAVVLQNVSYWTVKNIAVTNNAPTPGANSGILVGATDNNTYSGITIQSVDVTNVTGIQNRWAEGRYASAGILVQSPDKGFNLTGHFAGVTILNNTVHDVQCMGIAIVGGDGKDALKHNTGVLIKGNTVTRPGGDAILVGVSDSPLTEYNISQEAGWNNPARGAIAAIWAYTSENPTFQFNEATTTLSGADSMAWDCDWGVTGTCTYQYNYSNGNQGGFFMNCLRCFGGYTGVTMVLRGNISQNEGRIASNSDSHDNTLLMYNNTFDAPDQTFDIGMPDTATIENNIFVGKGLNPLPTTGKFRNNLWWGFPAPSNDTAAIAKDPLLVQDSAGGYGTGTTSGPTMGATSGFKLSAGSPALNSGVVIPDNGGKDFWGNPVSATTAPNVGAYNGAAQPAKWTKFNDTDTAHFTYSGTWGVRSNWGFGDNYQNDVHYTKTDGDSVTFTFRGTGVTVLTETNSDEGTVNWNLDNGAKTGSYNASSPARRTQVPILTLTDLSPTQQHTLTLTKASGTYMRIDRIDVLPATYNDTASQFTYTGSWGHHSNRGFGDYQDDVHYTKTDGDSVTFTFRGTGVTVLTETNSDEGTVNWNLDNGAKTGTYDASSPTRKAQVPILTLTDLSPTQQHTLTLTKASGTYMVIDRIDTLPATDTASQFTSTGSWGHHSNRGFGDYLDDIYYTKTDGDSVTFTFRGTGVTVLTETNSDEGTVNWNLDNGAKTGTYDASSPTRKAQVPILTLTDLSPTQQHTLTLTKASGTFMIIDCFDVTG